MFNHSQRGFFSRHFILLGFIALALSACAANDTDKSAAKQDTPILESGLADVFDAATGPLEDLNLKRKKIPEILAKVVEDPYHVPAKLTCKTVRSELAALEPLIGPDIKAKGVQVASNDSFIPDIPDLDSIEMPNVQKLAHDKLMSEIRSQTNILPFRSIIRRITGAEKHKKNYEEAYYAGKLRRAYLKGLAQSKFGNRCLKEPLPAQTKAKK
jgi:hypothetical protein